MIHQLKLLFKSPWFLFGAIIFSTLILSGILYPLIHGGDPDSVVSGPFQAPSKEYWLGTNNEGHDMLAKVLFGLRSSIFIGFAAATVATIIGTVIGLICGYKGGLVDDILTLITNLFLVIPSILVLIIISNSIEQRSSWLITLIIGLTSWPWAARGIRAQASSLREREHVELAKLNGYGTTSIIIEQILPYIMSYVFMVFILQMATAIMQEAAVSMMGLGPYDSATLGNIINSAQKTEALIGDNWWVFMPATLFITLLQFSLYLLNTSMEGIFNPKLQQKKKK